MYWSNPRKKPFKNWNELIDDILFNRLTIKEAAEKWDMSQPAISQWLKKHPSIKNHYYTRPWVERQLQIRFLPPECLDCQDMIDILEDESDERYVSEQHFSKVAEHVVECERCHKYQIEKRLDVGIPYRLDCPTIQDLLNYLDFPWHEGSEKIDTFVARHLLRCSFCSDELKSIVYSLEEENFEILNLVEQEIILYPEEGWRASLTSADLLQELIDVMEGHCQGPASQLMINYCSWRNLRTRIIL